MSHLFAKFEKNLKLNNFFASDINIFVEKTSNDTYLKIFNDNLQESSIKPINQDNLHSGVNVFVENEKFSFKSGVDIFEDTKPLKESRSSMGPADPLRSDGRSSDDPGVDISGIMALGGKNWKVKKLII